MNERVWIKGGGDLGSGVAHSLHRVGMGVLITELAQPLVIRRAVSLAAAIYQGTTDVEGITARRVQDLAGIQSAWANNEIPVAADPDGALANALHPTTLVDATLAKKPGLTRISDAPLVIGLGPGLIAGEHAHIVIETMRGHDLGRLILKGSARPDTKTPGDIAGYTWQRVLRAPCSGRFAAQVEIGDRVNKGQRVATVDETPIHAVIAGVIRGLLWQGLLVKEGTKVGDIDPRGIKENCFTISDKSRALGRAVLEAILYWRHIHPAEPTGQDDVPSTE